MPARLQNKEITAISLFDKVRCANLLRLASIACNAGECSSVSARSIELVVPPAGRS